VLDGISLRIGRGERVAVVGESGCGKSVTARVILGLLRGRRIAVQGRVGFEGRDLLGLSQRALRRLRGRRISMVFQDPSAALNPVFTVGDQLATVMLRGGRVARRRDAPAVAREALRAVSITDPERVLASYPFQLSGGLNQRIVITMALINRPALVIADEPGTALDVTVQAQTLTLMRELTQQAGAALLLISHNLGVVRAVADRVYVMYGGQVVEEAPVAELFEAPRHPYTRALLAAVPRLTGGALPQAIEGEIPDYLAPPSGCRFHPRCPHARPECREPPPVVEVAPGHRVACVLYREPAGG